MAPANAELWSRFEPATADSLEGTERRHASSLNTNPGGHSPFGACSPKRRTKIPNLKDIQAAPLTDAYLVAITPIINSATCASELFAGVDLE